MLSTPRHADRCGNLTLGFTLLVMTLFVLLIALQPPGSTQHTSAQSLDAPESGAGWLYSPDVQGAPYFHLRAGMELDPLHAALPQVWSLPPHYTP